MGDKEIKSMQLGTGGREDVKKKTWCRKETSAKVLRKGCKEPLQPEVSQDQGPQNESFYRWAGTKTKITAGVKELPDTDR